MEKGGSTKRQSRCVKELWRSGKRYRHRKDTVFPPALSDQISLQSLHYHMRLYINVVSKSIKCYTLNSQADMYFVQGKT